MLYADGDCETLTLVPNLTILNDDFALAAARAGRMARQDALAAGHSVVFIDPLGRYVEEFPL